MLEELTPVAIINDDEKPGPVSVYSTAHLKQRQPYAGYINVSPGLFDAIGEDNIGLPPVDPNELEAWSDPNHIATDDE